ncbi:MAG: hypothetical protein RBQ91_08040 [Acholeplasma sp.]|jgi:rRNA processing protein Krr1/Pno1|nr:hypothetical protein [Acholeplasma sp.]
MSKFFKASAVNSNLPVYINIDDISYIEGNQVRMKSLVAKEANELVRIDKKTEQVKVTTYLESETFDLTPVSMSKLLGVIEIL